MESSPSLSEPSTKRPRLSAPQPTYNDLVLRGSLLLEAITICYTEESPITKKQSAAADAYEELKGNSELRNVLMGFPPDHKPPASLNVVLMCNTGSLSATPMSINADGQIFRSETEVIDPIVYLTTILKNPDFRAATRSKFPLFYSYRFGKEFVSNLLGDDIIHGRQTLHAKELIRRL